MAIIRGSNPPVEGSNPSSPAKIRERKERLAHHVARCDEQGCMICSGQFDVKKWLRTGE